MPDYTVAMRLLCAILLLAARASAQEAIPAKPSPADYKAAAKAGSLTLAASFEGHTVPAPDASFVIQHYIVIELALYPGKNKEIEFDSGQFTLRLNGKKQTLFAQTPGMVAASLQYGSFENTRRLEASGGVGNAGVILGLARPPHLRVCRQRCPTRIQPSKKSLHCPRPNGSIAWPGRMAALRVPPPGCCTFRTRAAWAS